jgi:hypothetical protein
LRSFSHSDPLFSNTSALFSQNTRGGIPLPELVRCTEAQKSLFVSPLPATLTHSVSRKSFPCHSYANTRDGGATVAPVSVPTLRFRHHMRHVAPLSPVASVHCAYFLSPRRCTPKASLFCARCPCVSVGETRGFPAFRLSEGQTFRLLVQCWHFRLAPALSANRGVRREC